MCHRLLFCFRSKFEAKGAKTSPHDRLRVAKHLVSNLKDGVCVDDQILLVQVSIDTSQNAIIGGLNPSKRPIQTA